MRGSRRSPRSGSSVRAGAPGWAAAPGRHHADLARRRVRPEQVALDVHVERVPEVARGMVRRDVEHLEVGDVVLDLRALVDHEFELVEDPLAISRTVSLIGCSVPRRIDRPGVVTSTVSAQPGGELRRPPAAGPPPAPPPPPPAPRWPRRPPSAGPDGQRPDPAQHGRQVALPAQLLQLDRVEVRADDPPDGCHGAVAQRVNSDVS